MSEAPKDRARNPRRVPTPISFPRELTGDDLVKRRRSDDMWASRQGHRTTADQYVPGSRNPIIDMMETDDLTLLKRDTNRKDTLGRPITND